jgi:hypothetical protein
LASRTAWTAGNGVGLTWTTAINGSDLASLANGSTVLNSVADIANQTACCAPQPTLSSPPSGEVVGPRPGNADRAELVLAGALAAAGRERGSPDW